MHNETEIDAMRKGHSGQVSFGTGQEKEEEVCK